MMAALQQQPNIGGSALSQRDGMLDARPVEFANFSRKSRAKNKKNPPFPAPPLLLRFLTSGAPQDLPAMPLDAVQAHIDAFDVPEGWVRSAVPPKKGTRSLQYDYGVRIEQQVGDGEEAIIRWYCCAHSECNQSYQIKSSSTSITDHLFAKHGVGPSHPEKRRRISTKEPVVKAPSSPPEGGWEGGGGAGGGAAGVVRNANAPLPAVTLQEIDEAINVNFTVEEGWTRSALPAEKKKSRSIIYQYGVKVEQTDANGEPVVRWHCCAHPSCSAAYIIRKSSSAVSDHLSVTHGVGVSSLGKRKSDMPVPVALSSSMVNEQFVFAAIPDGEISGSCIRLEECKVEGARAGQIQVRTTYISVEPQIRDRMRLPTGRSANPSFTLHSPLAGTCVGVVTQSKCDGIHVGDFVHGFWPLKRVAVVESHLVTRIPPELLVLSQKGISHSSLIGSCGSQGMTAYFAIKEILNPKPGESVWVSSAAGAVGLVAGQLLKRVYGCRVLGTCGSDAKCTHLLRLGFDSAVNYRISDIRTELRKFAPDGLAMCFDNVGGETLDIALENMMHKGRIVSCGKLSESNSREGEGYKAKNLGCVAERNLMIRGVSVWDYRDQMSHASATLVGWHISGVLQSIETQIEGFDKFPQALGMLMRGEGMGKITIKV